jgi:hypothetical protein
MAERIPFLLVYRYTGIPETYSVLLWRWQDSSCLTIYCTEPPYFTSILSSIYICYARPSAIFHHHGSKHTVPHTLIRNGRRRRISWVFPLLEREVSIHSSSAATNLIAICAKSVMLGTNDGFYLLYIYIHCIYVIYVLYTECHDCLIVYMFTVHTYI